MSRYTLFILVLVYSGAFVHCQMPSCPGRNKTLGRQCADRGYNALCKAADPAERCTVLKCTETGRGDIPVYSTYRIGPALQGSWCGENKICIQGKCHVDPTPPENSVAYVLEKEYDCINNS